jgi:hypothetical protein
MKISRIRQNTRRKKRKKEFPRFADFEKLLRRADYHGAVFSRRRLDTRLIITRV